MKPPPFLLGATLLYWGWQTDLLAPSFVMALVIEAPRFIKLRLDWSDEEFSRIWTFCALLFMALAVYAFTANEGPANFSSLFSNPSMSSQTRAGASSARAAAALIRWSPMVFFLFIAAQCYSSRQAIPLEIISLLLRLRWKRARKRGRPLPDSLGLNISYPYFMLCLLAASVHPPEDLGFFLGFCALLAWGLWPLRSPRFSALTWTIALLAALGAGYAGQRGIVQLQRLAENANLRWFSRFSRRGYDPKQIHTELGQIGELKLSGNIVIRLDPKDGSHPPTHLREAGYQQYMDETWFAGRTGETFTGVAHGTNEDAWILQAAMTNAARVNIACYLPGGPGGLLPLPIDSTRLNDLPAYTLQKNSEGAVLAQGPGLLIFDALYGANATMDSPPETNDFRVPTPEQPALAQVISESHLDGLDRNRTLEAVGNFFRSTFTYSTWLRTSAQSRNRRMQSRLVNFLKSGKRQTNAPALLYSRAATSNNTALASFLLDTRSGHCEYFATATVLLLRQLGFPARYAVGYAVHEASGKGYVVRQRDAHAWCMVWNPRLGRWEDFDTTPASWVEAEEKRASWLEGASDLVSWLHFQFSKFRWGQTHLRQYILWALTPALCLLFYQIFFQKKWRAHSPQAGPGAARLIWPGHDSEFYLLEGELSRRNAARLPAEPLSAWLRRIMADPALAKLEAPLRQLLRLHYRYRFDPRGLSLPDRDALKDLAGACVSNLSAAKPPARLP